MKTGRRNDSVKFGERYIKRDHQKRAINVFGDITSKNISVINRYIVEERSDEVATILSLLRQPIVAECIVTVNAIGGEKEIVQQIIAQNSKYVLVLRKDQDVFYEKIQSIFALALLNNFAQVKHQFHQSIQKNVDTIETRQYWVINDPAYIKYIDPKGDWNGLRSIGIFQLIRQTDSNIFRESRYYLLSFDDDARKFAEAIRTPYGALKLVFIGC